ncbi:TPM domain-containing protein [Aquimarina sp. 2201CG1-2-11]|uniref:TPM domain-containing protein n=1 Tax=Aquimarina discodermiae TaxID=3231043 RepID=UPI00346340B3
MKKTQQLTVLFLLFVSLISCKWGSKQETTKKSVSTVTLSEIEKNAFPKPIGIINDYSQVFTNAQKSELSKTLYDYDQATTRQIVVVTVDSIASYPNIQKYATVLGQKWGVGTTEKNNGLIMVLCKPKRKIGIATGYGTELVLTDVICKKVIDSTMIPEFKNGNFYKGIKKGIEDLITKW